jgi:putative pyruvate formate lyase activating enzyme
MGRVVNTEEFVTICLALQKKGAENINIVTGSHAAAALASGIDAARKAGLHIPVLWNTSSYEGQEILGLLRDRIDWYLPDFKTLDHDIAARFFKAPDYPEVAAAAIIAMMDARPGHVIVRHLALPGHLEATREVLRWFADNCQSKAQLSLMTQYTPVTAADSTQNAAVFAVERGSPPDAKPALPDDKPVLPDRFINNEEYDTMLGWLEEFGIEDGYYQELETGSDWLPDFKRENPFSSNLSEPVWHWEKLIKII